MDEENEVNACIINTNISLSAAGLHELEKEKNKLFSPLTIHTLLSVLSQDPSYFAANNFKWVLTSCDNEIYVKCYTDFISFLRSYNKEILSLTNKLFLQENNLLEEEFEALINNFNYETSPADFYKTDSSINLINSWIEDKTKGVIRDIISSNSLKESTCLAMLNAVHFKGKWDISFISENNPMTFHLNKTDSISVPMMKVTGEFIYTHEESRFEFVELPLTSVSDDLGLIVCLPENNEMDPYDYNDSSLRWYLNDILSNEASKKEMEILLPKFKIEELVNARNILTELNLAEKLKRKIFGMMNGGKLLNYAQIDAKNSIIVDEAGIEAASGLICSTVPADLDEEVILSDGLKMSEMNIKTTVSNRFAKTVVTCKVHNSHKAAKEATFKVVLPETAFITEFVMEMNGKSYKSYVKEKAHAKAIYDEAVAVGKSAGIVEADKRDSTQFAVSVNLEPQSVAVFLLTYEEMLERIHDHYNLILNICPGRIVDNLNVEVVINESRPIKFVKTPPLRSGGEFSQRMEKYLQPSANIKVNSNSAVVKFNLDTKEQKKFCSILGTPMPEGFSGQFIVEYDVERDPKNGEILLQDGYFVHFFAPNDLDPLPKHVVFVLDTSGSMHGRKIIQLKDAMMSILNEIRTADLISIIEFNYDVKVWDINSEDSKSVSPNQFNNYDEPFGMLSEFSLPDPSFASDEVKAKNIVKRMCADGGTFMIGGLEAALYVIKVGQTKVGQGSKYQPIIVFLTDGAPNVGTGSTPYIVEIVTKLNQKLNKASIFSLSFGVDADKAFLRELSLKNFGFSRHIYEASDASLQLQAFYKQISSPLLADINFKYEADVTEVTRSRFPIYFRGSELIVSGRYRGSHLPNTIHGYGPFGSLNLESIIRNPVTSLERLWAYLTVKQLLEERNVVEDSTELTQKAVKLALKYSFVTEVTSLVVVKPDEICDTSLENDDAPSAEDRVLLSNAGLPKKKFIKKRKLCSKMVENAVLFVEEIPEEITVVEVENKVEKKSQFIADRPFLVVLVLRKGDSRIVLFMGWVYRPSI